MADKKSFYVRDAKRAGITVEQYLWYRENGYKKCTKCKKWKFIECFPKDKSRPDGIGYLCLECKRVKEPRKPVVPDWARDALRHRNKQHRWRKGIPLSIQHRKRLRDISIEQKRFCGPNSPQWKGGVTPKSKVERGSSKYREWRTAVFARDNYTCRKCGDSKGGNLHAHHVKSWADHPELRYDVSNGVTLCVDCHQEKHDVPLSIRKVKRMKQKTQLRFEF